MSTAIFNRKVLAAILAALALLIAGCGGGGSASKSSTRSSTPAATTFGWLHPGSPPAGWHAVRIPSGAVLAYPPSWRPVHGDPGTASAVVRDRSHRVVGYLNVTPQQGAETAGNWTRFRPTHNGEEGDTSVRTLATATGLKFRTGRGSCVEDSYTTTTGARFVEVACLVQGDRTSSVVVGASPPPQWSQISPLLERSISALSVH